jgi:F-type H+-transporting ATPase subunit delta
MAQHQQHNSPLSVAYARSLLELATAQNQAEPIGQELADIEKVIESDPAFETFLSNPAVGEVERGQVIEKVFRGRVSPLLANFLGVVNRKGRLGLLRQIASGYQELLDAQLGKIEVDVIVAEKLSPDQLEQVRQRVSAALKRDAVVHQYIDPSIIGGLVIRVEDRLLDASVRAQLRAVRRQLLAARPR